MYFNGILCRCERTQKTRRGLLYILVVLLDSVRLRRLALNTIGTPRHSRVQQLAFNKGFANGDTCYWKNISTGRTCGLANKSRHCEMERGSFP